jgi:hypothetical protein
VLRFVRCSAEGGSVVRRGKNNGQREKRNIFLLHALCSMPHANLLTPDTWNPETGAQNELFFSSFLFLETKLDTTFHQTPLKSYEKTLDIFPSLPIMWKKSLTVHLFSNNYSVKRFLNSKNLWCHEKNRKPNPWDPMTGAVLRRKWRLSTRRSETTCLTESGFLIGSFGWEIDLPSLLPGKVAACDIHCAQQHTTDKGLICSGMTDR